MCPSSASTLAPHDTRHAYTVLRGLTSSGGGMVAAATMSLPERASQGRNYDYRYVWIRDQCFTGQAIAAAGAHPLLDDAVSFVSARLLDDGPKLTPAYTTGGGRVPDQRSLHLPGYPGGTTSSATTSTPSSSSTRSGSRCCCSPPPPATTTWTPRAGGRRRPQPTRSPPAGSNPRQGYGNWTTSAGARAG